MGSCIGTAVELSNQGNEDYGQACEGCSSPWIIASESDVCRRQIMTSKVGPHAERVNIHINIKNILYSDADVWNRFPRCGG